MAFFTKSNPIRYFISQLGMINKRFNMVSIEIMTFIITTFLTGIIISFVYSLSPLSIFRSTPESFLFCGVFTIFIIWVRPSSLTIHGIIGSRHPLCLSKSRGIRFFRLAFIPGRMSLKQPGCSFTKLFFSLWIVYPLEGNPVMNRALGNLKCFKNFLCCTIVNPKFFSYFSHRYFIINIPSINEVFQRFRMQPRKLLDGHYKRMFMVTFMRTIEIFMILKSIWFCIKSLITNGADKIFSFFHNYIISQNQQNVHALCGCGIGTQ